MKKITALFLCIILSLLLPACGKKEEVRLQAEEVRDIIVNYFNTDGINDSNYAGCEADEENNIVKVYLKDISSGMQEEFIYKVFSNRAGSAYINI